MSVTKLLKAQVALNEQINKSTVNYKKTGKARRTSSYIKTRIEEVNTIWQRFYENHLKIYEIEDGDAGDYLKGTLYESTEALYVDHLSELKEELKALAEPEEQPSLPMAPATGPKQNLKLAQISIPPFDGKYSSWRSFHDLFKSLVHKDPNLSKVQKLHYLKTSVIGEAERLLRQFEITEHNYQRAWELLDKRYNNKRVLVKTHPQKLRDQPSIKGEDHEAIKGLIDQTEESLHELRALGIDTASWDVVIIDLLEEKLPSRTQWAWHESLGSNTELPTYERFIAFLEARFRTIEALHAQKEPHKVSNRGQRSSKGTVNLFTKSKTCPKCQDEHILRQCSAFKNLAVNERIKFIKNKKICTNCLGCDHHITKCPSKGTCLQCHKRHHTMLHQDRDNRVSPTKEEESVTTQNFLAAKLKKAMLSTALIRVKGHVLRAIVDSGSQVSFITEKACKKLNLPQQPADIQVTGLSNTNTAHVQTQVSTTIQSLRSAFKMQVEALVVQKITDTIPEQRISTTNLSYITGLPLADPHFAEPGPIDMLLGADIYGIILEAGLVKGPSTTPTAQNTALGWILVGQIQGTLPRQIQPKSFVVTAESATEHLDKQLRQFWETEEIRSPVKLNPEDQRCEDHYQSTHKRTVTGKYQVALPFKNTNGPELGQSRYIAIRQFLQIERKLARCPESQALYKQCIQEYFDLGHAREVSADNTNKTYYLPHHAVYKDSTTTKLRVVFNASAKTSNGMSLNEQLLTGPTIQPTLWATLLKWRKYEYAMTADIEKMYRMIDITKEHQNYQRIVWRDNPNQEIKDYALTTVTFGTAPAPFLAIRTLHQLAQDVENKFPIAAKSLRQDFYVDDLLTGAHTIEQGLDKQGELITVLTQSGFNLRKWTANHSSLLENIPIEHRELKTELTLSENDSIKTLGIRWHPATDTFSFSVNLPPKRIRYTKRQVVSEIASLFDPLGWIAPCIITAKILIQRLWLSGCTWDERIPEPIEADWLTFRDQIQLLQALTIPRWVHYSPHTTQIELHGSCDASKHAYAAVIYLRVVIEAKVHTTLLVSKTRVAPTKPISLPRLELCGAVLLTRLLVQTRQDMKVKHVSTYAWTDSRISLAWIQGSPQRWKTYVANRVAEIQEYIPPASWHHVGSKDNPADCASRGINPSVLQFHDLWWQGPEWLRLPKENWPAQPCPIEPRVEVKPVVNLLNMEEIPWLNKFSKFTTLIRVTAYCLRFIRHCRQHKKSRTAPTHLTVTELKAAELKVVQLVQRVAFPQEYKLLQNNQTISRKSRLLCLHPFIKDQVVRLGGRLENSALTFDQKHPILLPNNHPVSALIINHVHELTLHGGTQLVLNTLRTKYWMINARNTIRHRLHKCLRCFKINPKTSQQIMANLPVSRVNPSLPFEHTGVDYAGPISIKSSKIRNAKIIKGYLCLFICMATKAIHIEIVTELTTSGFIAALRRFISRRGKCSNLYSDCGTNFVGANKVLDQEFKDFMRHTSAEIQQKSAAQGIEWHFNPPSAPHFGGLWESGVKLVKTHMKKYLQNTALTYEELSTAVCQIEACVNSRPLSPLSNDPNDYNALTPGHFLTGRNILAIPESPLKGDKFPLKRWQYIQRLVQQFWNVWSKEYLQTLQERPKWKSAQQNLKVNELVLIKDDRFPPMQWSLGRIIKLHPGSDQQVRVATVKTATNTITRPITKLCPLPRA